MRTEIETTSDEAPAAAFNGAAHPRIFPSPASDAGAPTLDGANVAEELAELQVQAVRAMRDYIFAAVDGVGALGGAVDAPFSLTSRIGQLRRKGLSASEMLDDFIESTNQILGTLNDGAHKPRSARPRIAPMARRQDGVQSLPARLQSLTERENCVLGLLLKGLPNKQIAHELGVSIATAKAHIGAILRKLEVSNRARVIALLANTHGPADPRRAPGNS